MRLLLMTILVFTMASTPLSAALGCFASPDKSETVSVSIAPGTSAELRISYWEGNESTGQEAFCTSVIHVKLSGFPTSRVATRPGDVAAAVRDVADLWKVSECQVTVVFENDTSEELAEHETCVTGLFRYDKGDYWSSSSEDYCWEPADEIS
jgi:hypothetical protein